MTVRRDGDIVRLEGDVRVDEAETLTALLQADPTRPVDLSACTGLHTAVAQALIAFRARIRGASPDPFVDQMLAPAVITAVEFSIEGHGFRRDLDNQPANATSRPPISRSS